MTQVTSTSPLAGGKKRARSTGPLLDEPEKRHKADSATINPAVPFTDRFFIDMAATIVQDFPISEFAKAHCCSTVDVFDALSAVVLSPIQEPQPWHGAESVSEYSQILIAEWRGRQIERVKGTSSAPITISDTSRCSSLVNSPQPSASEASLDSQNSVASLPETENSSETHPLPSAPAEDTTANESTPEVKTLGDKKLPSPRRESTATRTEVRVDIYGTCIPADKWIDGYHIPALPKIRRDGLSDAEFYEMLSDGWFD